MDQPNNASRRNFLQKTGVLIGTLSLPTLLFRCTTDELEASLTLLFPEGQEAFTGGESIQILWEEDFVERMDIYFSLDNGQNWALIDSNIDPQNKPYVWTLPIIDAEQCFIRVEASNDSMLRAQNIVSFRIISPALELQLLNPVGGAFFEAGQTIDISWQYNKEALIDLQYAKYKGGPWTTIASGINTNDGLYQWQSPNFTSASMVLRATESDSGIEVDRTMDAFAIAIPAYFSIEGIEDLAEIGGRHFTFVLGGEDVSITRTGEGTFDIMSLACTHYQCRVNWVDKADKFICPCHGAQFTKEGCVISGPTDIPLPKYRYRFDAQENILTIFFKVLIPEENCS